MLVALLKTKLVPRGDYLLDAFASGVNCCGDTSIIVGWEKGWREKLARVEVAIQVCFPSEVHKGTPQSKFRLRSASLLKERSIPVLTIDTGVISSQFDATQGNYQVTGKKLPRFDIHRVQDYPLYDELIYYLIGTGGPKRLGNFFNQDSPSDRWDQLGIQLVPWRKDGGHILLLDQRRGGISSRGVDTHQWWNENLPKLAAVTKRPFIFRQHPNSPASLSGSKSFRKLESSRRLQVSTNKALEDDLRGAWAAVGYSTNALITSAILGIPVFIGSEVSLATPVASLDLAKLEAPSFPDRRQWAYDLAYGQWNCRELKDGTAWRHLRPRFVRDVTPAAPAAPADTVAPSVAPPSRPPNDLLLVTSFSEDLYEASARSLLQTFLAYPQPGPLLVCYEGRLPQEDSPRLIYESLDHDQFLQSWLAANRDVIPVHLGGHAQHCKCPNWRERHAKHKRGCHWQWMNRNSSRWFRKVASLRLAAQRGQRWLLWVDADVRFRGSLPFQEIVTWLGESGLVYCRGHRPAVESGILLWDLEQGGREAIEKLCQRYTSRAYLTYNRWDDGFQLASLLDEKAIQGRDLVHPTRWRGHTSHVVPTTPWRQWLDHVKGLHGRRLGIMS